MLPLKPTCMPVDTLLVWRVCVSVVHVQSCEYHTSKRARARAHTHTHTPTHAECGEAAADAFCQLQGGNYHVNFTLTDISVSYLRLRHLQVQLLSGRGSSLGAVGSLCTAHPLLPRLSFGWCRASTAPSRQATGSSAVN